MKCSEMLILTLYFFQLWISPLNGHRSSRKIIYKDLLLKENDDCHTDSGTVGRCQEITSCKTLSKFQKRSPKLCSWNKNIPVICCPKNLVRKLETERIINARCGIRQSEIKGRKQTIPGLNRTDVNFLKISLIGGKETTRNSWPWMVSIHRRTGQLTQFLCGGSIINDQYILTAAHCFSGNNRSSSNYVLKVAGHRKTSGMNYNVKMIKLHFLYKPSEHYYDIALLKVEGRIRFDDRTSPCCLPSNDDKNTGKSATIIGWGDTSFGGRPSDVLQEANVKIWSNAACDRSYRKLSLSSFPKGITDNLICAGVSKGGIDACQGDSGGPLMLKDFYSEKWKIIGIVSFGYQCGIEGYPGVYTRVSKFISWITKNT